MSDWQIGDLALCVRACAEEPRLTFAGRIYSVTGIIRDDFGNPCLTFEGLPSEGEYWLGFSITRFRKIRPHTPDEQDEITIRLLNGIPVEA